MQDREALAQLATTLSGKNKAGQFDICLTSVANIATTLNQLDLAEHILKLRKAASDARNVKSRPFKPCGRI